MNDGDALDDESLDETPETDGERVAYDKLVRDDIPRIVREDGSRPETRVVDGAELSDYLAAKLVEEAREYAEDRRAGELGDVLDVVDAVVAHEGFDADAIDRERAAKTAERGGFERGLVLDAVVEGGADGDGMDGADGNGEDETAEGNAVDRADDVD